MGIIESLIKKDLFSGLNKHTWLYTGAESPPHQGSIEAINDYFQSRSKGSEGRDRNDFIEQSSKENIAKLVNGEAHNVAFLSNSSEIISMISQSLQLKKGDNVVINELEFPSGVLPWLLLQKKGVEVRLVEHKEWVIETNDILEQVDENTRLVMISHVSYLSGTRIDNKKLYKEIKRTNALLLTDVTQSLGAIPVDIKDTDFLVCSSYKWLLSIHGLGILVLNPDRTKDVHSRSIGWRSVAEVFSNNRFKEYELYNDARKFNLGFPSYPTLYTLNFTTELLLGVGNKKIEEHILRLGGLLQNQLREHGYQMLTPSEPNKRAGNISFIYPDGGKLAEKLREEHIFVWGGDGRVRVSVHLFNDSNDIEIFMKAFLKIARSLTPKTN